MKVKLTLISFISLIVLAVVVGYWYQQQHAQHAPTSAKTPEVTVRSLHEQIVPQSISAYGRIISPASVQVKAQVNGVVTSLDFTPGETIKKGQTIFTLRSSDTGTQLKTLLAQMLSSQQLYQRSLKASHLSPGAIAKSNLQTEKLQYQQDLAAYQQAKTINSATAPIKGVITATDYSTGDFINSGDVIATIVATNTLQLQYHLPSQYAAKVKLGQSVIFSLPHSTNHYLAKVSYIAPELTADSTSLTLRASLSTQAGLLVNTFGKLQQMINPHFSTLVVPQQLVQSDAQGFFVFLLKNHKVSKQYFQVGDLTKQGLLIVEHGLNVNDVLITTDPKTLSPGQVVKVKQ